MFTAGCGGFAILDETEYMERHVEDSEVGGEKSILFTIGQLGDLVEAEQ
jgi:hypothetical protein